MCVRDADHRRVRPGQARELTAGEGRDVFLRRELALAHRGQDHVVATAAKLGRQGGDDVLQTAVAPGWNGQPRPGIHQDLHDDRPGRHARADRREA
jgi:hypothetical protein